MSRLVDKIKAEMSPESRRYAVMEPPMNTVSVESTISDAVMFPTAIEYQMRAHFGAAAIARDTIELELQQRNIRHQVVEEVFGEFRPMIMKVKEALYMCDFRAADTELNKLYDQMFRV